MKSLVVRNSNNLKNNNNWQAIDDFEGLIDRFFNSNLPYQGEEGMLHMPIDLIERDNNLIMRVMMPGMKKENINVDISEGQVNISGICSVDYEENKDLIHRSEFCRGNFSRSITLPQKIDHKKSKADYKDGILTLILPKSEQEKNKVVRISL